MMMRGQIMSTTLTTIDSWSQFIKAESQKDYYKILAAGVAADAKCHTIFPRRKDLFSAFNLCPLEKIKVVILGQDPYHGDNQAHGLAFSVQPGIDIPPSLRNIYKEINSDYDVDHKFPNGCLSSWAEQGVLLLNTVLTVKKSSAGSHKGYGWEVFTDNAISLISSQDRPIVFMLWGAFAKSKKNLITNPDHLILEAAHPSPLSAYNGFFGCKHFTKANEFLRRHNVDVIDWFINV
jgi:uracil-DNA glycosylase